MITNLKVISASQNSFSPPVCEMPQKFLIQILSSTYLFIRIDTYIYIYVYTWTGSEHPSPTLTLLKLVWPHLKHPALCETEATTGCASTENRKDD